MIQSKEDLKYYLEEDRKRYTQEWPIPSLKDWILSNEKWYTYKYIKRLRYTEYYFNTGKKLLFLYSMVRLKRLGFKIKYQIELNTVGPGFIIYHTGDMVNTQKRCKIGRNFTMRPGCVFANKYISNNPEPVIIGDNVTFGLGVKVIGSVTIGNNVTVGANAVVTKDIPDNAIVGGVPARVIRIVEK